MVFFIYLTNTQPYIMHLVGVISIYMIDIRKTHFLIAKMILYYLKGTKKQGNNCKLVGLIDSDWAECLDDQKSTSSYVFYLGSNVIWWSSKKQKLGASFN